jgi:hypothetical protein
MPLNTVTVDHSDSSYIYVGGELGVYYKSMTGTQWISYSNKLPNVSVKDLEIHYGSNRLRAATHGRGLWEYTLVGRNEYPAITHTSITSTPDDASPKEGVDQFIYATIDYVGSLSTVQALWALNGIDNFTAIPMTAQGNNVWKSTTPVPHKNVGDMLYFKVEATSTLGQKSESYTFNYKVKEFDYCEAMGSAGTGSDYISSVKVGNITKSSVQDYYGNFTSTVFEMNNDSAYTMEVGLNYSWDEDSVIAWIDYNLDASFTSDEEIVFSKLINHKCTASISAPTNVNLDTDMRMRVRSSYNSNFMSPCGDQSGEVEDYTVRFVKATNSVGPTKVISAAISPNPSNGNFEIKLSEKQARITVSMYDITGKLVYSIETANEQMLPISIDLNTGSYLLHIDTDKGRITEKVIID